MYIYIYIYTHICLYIYIYILRIHIYIYIYYKVCSWFPQGRRLLSLHGLSEMLNDVTTSGWVQNLIWNDFTTLKWVYQDLKWCHNFTGFQRFEMMSQLHGLSEIWNDVTTSGCYSSEVWIQSIHVLRICKLRISESKLLGNSLWAWEFHPLKSESASVKASEIQILTLWVDRKTRELGRERAGQDRIAEPRIGW